LTLPLPSVLSCGMSDADEPPTLKTFQGHEIYPMPMFPTIAVADVAVVSAWYQAALGFTVVFAAPGGAMVHLRRQKYQDLLIVPSREGAATAPATLSITFNVDGEIEALATRARGVAALGASSVAGPLATPWNTLDVRVTDPAGHRLVFTARNPNPDPDQAARMKALFDAPTPTSE
jgi:uncharacterized glyoxalase superfamily protein PhnB